MLARVYQKVTNKRRDFLHKLSTRIVEDDDGVCVEDLSIKGLARTKLGGSFGDAAHGEFGRMLEYKCFWNNKPFVRVNRFFPSTRLHARCGTLNSVELSHRTFVCGGCGQALDRDLNAAVNIREEGLRIMLAAGHAESANARGEDVRPAH